MGGFIFLLSQGMFTGLMWPLLRMFLMLAFVLILAYYVTRLIARSKSRARDGLNLNLVESISVGAGAMVQLVRCGEKYLVVGITKENVNLLAVFSRDEISENELEPVSVPFEKVLARFTQKKGDDV